MIGVKGKIRKNTYIGRKTMQMLDKNLQEIIERAFNMDRLSPDVRKQVMDYIVGETETIQLSPIDKLVGYHTSYMLEGLLEGKNKELALRCYYVFYLFNSKAFFMNSMGMESSYELYHTLGLEPCSVVEGITMSLVTKLNYNSSSVFNAIKNNITDYENKGKKSLFGQADTYYGNAFQDYVLKQRKDSKEISPTLLYLEGVRAVLSQNNASQEMQAFEKEIEELIPFIYDKHPLFTPSYEKQKRNELQAIALSFSIVFHKKSTKFQELLCKQIQLCDNEYVEELLSNQYKGGATEEMAKLLEDVSVANAYKADFYADRMLRDSLFSSKDEYHRPLLAIYKEDPDSVLVAYETLKRGRKPGAFLLFTFLRARGVEFEKEEVRTLETLLEYYVGKVAAENKVHIYRPDRRVYQAPLMLYEVSEVAKTQVREVVAAQKMQSVLVDIEAASRFFFKEIKGNILEELAKEMGVKLILSTAIEREPKLSAEVLREFIQCHLEETDELMREKIKAGEDNITKYAEKLYTEDIGMKVETLVSVFNHRLKTVISFMEAFVVDREEQVRGEIQKLRNTKNKNMQEAFDRLETKWDSKKHTVAIEASRTLEEVASYISSFYKPANDKLIPYLEEVEGLMMMKDKEGKEFPLVLLKYYLSEYMRIKEIQLLEPCEAVKKLMDEGQLRLFTNELYDKWMKEGADTKKKNILILYALNGENTELVTLKKQIDEWTENARGALAAFAVTAMAIKGSGMALMLTDGIATKCKNKQVKAAAAEALDLAAKARGLSKEALVDKIVPTLGFNENRELHLSYGIRDFKAKLTPQMEIILFDEEKQKVIKSLPKPGVSDDEEKAQVAKETFTGLKKQLKTILATQQQRLAKALLTGRSWQQESWRELFVKNPIMNSFAISLIWGEYNQEGDLLGTFRYMEDGSFNTVEEEEYSLSEGTAIRLVHPMDLKEEEKVAWEQQLEDYEITQSILQLSMPIYTLEKEDEKERTFMKYKDSEVYYGKVIGIMNKHEWLKTSGLDGGCAEGFYYEDKTSGIGMLLRLDNFFMTMEAIDTVRINELIFYKGGTFNVNDYYIEKEMENNIIPLKDVPAKVLNLGLTIIHLLIPEKEGK